MSTSTGSSSASSAQQLPGLLRFLVASAKLPLAQAMGSARKLIDQGLVSESEIAAADADKLAAIFPDAKVCKTVQSAATRVTKKRANPDAPNKAATGGTAKESPSKRRRKADPALLEVPEPIRDEAKINAMSVTTNRAPLFLAFAFIGLKYTNPEQPVDSRLSLAQGVVAANSISKAKSIGMAHAAQKDEEHKLGGAQKSLMVMSREIQVLRRWGLAAASAKKNAQAQGKDDDVDHLGVDPDEVKHLEEEDPDFQPAVWAIDPSLLNKTSTKHPGTTTTEYAHLPIYKPDAALGYLKRSFAKPADALPLLLGALELLFESWSEHLSPAELNKKGWSWYCQVRPDVQQGSAGWGQKNQVELSKILDLRRKA